jgi:hypothetical protein
MAAVVTVYVCTDQGQHPVAYLGEWTAELAEQVAGTEGMSGTFPLRSAHQPRRTRPSSGFRVPVGSQAKIGPSVTKGESTIEYRRGGAVVSWRCPRCERALRVSLKRLGDALALTKVDISTI